MYRTTALILLGSSLTAVVMVVVAVRVIARLVAAFLGGL